MCAWGGCVGGWCAVQTSAIGMCDCAAGGVGGACQSDWQAEKPRC